jgi:hypothetical protein
MKRFAGMQFGIWLALGVGAAGAGETNRIVTTPLLPEGPLLTLTPPATPRNTNSLPTAPVDQDGRMMSLEATRCSGLGFTIERRLTPEEVRRVKARQETKERIKTLEKSLGIR